MNISVSCTCMACRLPVGSFWYERDQLPSAECLLLGWWKP